MAGIDRRQRDWFKQEHVTLLYKETAQRIELEALDKLCKLFECEVGEILEFQEDDK